MIRSTKYFIPPARRSLVTRPQLTRKLEEGMETKLTLVSAQAGYGKTTALSEWARQCQASVAWVSLDKYDNDWGAFWSCVFASIRERLPLFGQSIEFLLEQESAASIDFAVSAFLNELSSIRGDFVLILDDYHVIENTFVNESIRYMLEHLPPYFHLYIASRTELSFPTTRLLAKGDINVIRIEDMRFELEEGVVFFREMTNLSLSIRQISTLFEQTEGWVSGLQLAAITLKRSSNITDTIDQFSGRQRQISDYLLEEVFGHLSEFSQQFLLSTSVLCRMNGEMCTVVTGQADSQVHLERLEQLNLFIIPLDEQRDWFRYHHLLSEFLQQLCATDYPELWRLSHHRAAAWYENEGLYEEAVEHYIRTEQAEDAVRIIDRIMPELLQSRSHVVRRWIKALPESSFEHKPMFQLYRISQLLMDRDWEQGLRKAEQAEKRFNVMKASIPEPEWKQLMGNLCYLNALFFRMQQNMPRALHYFELLDHYLPEGSSLQKASTKRYLGHEGFGDPLSLIVDLHEMEQFQLKLITMWGKKPNYPFVGYAYLSYSSLMHEWNRLDEVESCIGQALSRKDLRANVWTWIQLGLVSSRLKQALGREEEAIESLTHLGSSVESPDQPIIWKRIKAEQARLYLLQGQRQKVYDWLEQSGMSHSDEVSARYFEEYLVLVRVIAGKGRIEDALQLFEKLESLAEKENRLRERIRLKILHSMVLRQSEEPQAALAPLVVALRLSEPLGYIRSFLDEGPQMVEMLAELLNQQPKTALPLLPLNYIRLILSAVSSNLSPKSFSNEALTEKEKKVFKLLAEGFIYKEIADQLNVTQDTVKFHLKNIYRKLRINNRAEAIMRAKEYRKQV